MLNIIPDFTTRWIKILVFMTFIALLMPLKTAHAAWGGWEDLGGVLTSPPNCVSWGGKPP